MKRYLLDDQRAEVPDQGATAPLVAFPEAVQRNKVLVTPRILARIPREFLRP